MAAFVENQTQIHRVEGNYSNHEISIEIKNKHQNALQKYLSMCSPTIDRHRHVPCLGFRSVIYLPLYF